MISELTTDLMTILKLHLVYRKGGGNTIYTGAQKYALRNFGQQFLNLV